MSSELNLNQVEIKVDERLTLILWLMEVSGLWSRDIFLGKWNSFMYNCFHYFVHFYGILNFTLLSLYLFLNDAIFEDFIMCLNAIISITVFIVRAYPFLCEKQKIENIISGLEKHFFIHGSRLMPRQSSTMKKVIANAKILIISLCFLFYITTVVMISVPFVALLSTNTHRLNTTESIDKPLSWPFWYPFDVTETRYYLIAVVQQTIGTIIEGAVLIPVPILFYYLLIMYTTAQFELLSISLRYATDHVITLMKEKHFNAGSRNYKNSDELTDNNVIMNKAEVTIFELDDVMIENADATSGNTGGRENRFQTGFPLEEIQAEMSSYLLECVQHHQSLTEYVEELNSLLSPLFFCEFATGAVLICLLGFSLMEAPPGSVVFVKGLLHLSCVILMLAFNSWFGTRLISQSTAVYQAAYECEWYDQSPYFKHLLKMIIMRAQKPVTINAGYFGSISLPMFSKVMQTSYSYLAVLRQMKAE